MCDSSPNCNYSNQLILSGEVLQQTVDMHAHRPINTVCARQTATSTTDRDLSDTPPPVLGSKHVEAASSPQTEKGGD